jgi:hypothetical protein
VRAETRAMVAQEEKVQTMMKAPGARKVTKRER